MALPTLREVLLEDNLPNDVDRWLTAYETAGRLSDDDVERFGPMGSSKRTRALDARYTDDAYAAACIDLTLRWARRDVLREQQ